MAAADDQSESRGLPASAAIVLVAFGEGGMAYGLGVDLGTTYSAAAVARDGRVEAFTLGTTAPAIPSVVVLRADGEVLVGEAAERRAATEPTRTAREFKRRLGDPTPIVVGGTPFGAEALMAHVLRSIVRQVTEREGAPPDLVVLTHPANYGQFKTDLLREAARLAGLDQSGVALLAEPEAAAINYAMQQRVEIGEIVAVYDFGGGTFDAAVVRKSADGFEIVGVPEGIERLGGIDIDAAVLAHVDAVLDHRPSGLDASDQAVRTALARLRDECRRAKEALSTDTDTSIPVSLPGLQTEVRLTRDELEAMIRPRIRETVEALQRAVASAGLTMDQVSRVLLVGGTSRIPLIGELLREATGRPIALDAHPKFAIASGAAASASSRLASQAAAAAPASPTAAPSAVRTAAAAPAAAAHAVPGSTVAAPVPASSPGRSRLPIVVVAVIALLVVAAIAAFALMGPRDPGVAAGPTTSASLGEPPASVAATPASAVPSPLESGAASGPPLSGPGAGIVTTVAGIGGTNNPLAGEGGPAVSAALSLSDDVAIAPNDDVYLADRNTSRVLRIRDEILTVLYRGDFGAGENDMSGVAVAPDGSVLFTTGLAIRRISPDGGDSAVVAATGPGFVSGGGKLAIAADGTTYYATGRLAPRVYRVESNGSLTPVAGTGSAAVSVGDDGVRATDASFGSVSDLAVDSEGRLYISDEGAGVVRVVAADGTIETVVGGGSVDPGTLDDPGVALRATDPRLPGSDIGIAFDATDRLYFTHAGFSFVGRVAADGNIDVISANASGTELGRPAAETQIFQPSKIAVAPSGDLLILVEGGNRLWRIAAAGD